MEEKSLSQFQKKKNFKGVKEINKRVFGKQQPGIFDNKKRNFARKFVEQQATKAFIKKEDKTNNKAKPKLKSSIDKRDFKNAKGISGLFQNKFKVYNREHKNCFRKNCKGKIIKIFITNRSSFICKFCQK